MNNWFVTLKDVSEATKAWRMDYNEFKSPSALGDLSSLQYVHKTEKTLLCSGLQWGKVT